MSDFPPLGAMDVFRKWSESRSWGPNNAYSVTFGSGVVADLVVGLRAHPQAVEKAISAKAEAYPVVLGSVMLLTSADVVDALIEIGSCCIAVDKSAYGSQLERLSHECGGV